MTATGSRRFVSRRTALAGLGAGGLGVALAAPRATGAQESVGHPIVGAWEWNNDPNAATADPSCAVFNAEGTYVEFYPLLGVGIGAWQATGERSAILTIKFQDSEPDPNLFTHGINVYRLAIEVDDSGNVLTATGDQEVRDAAGNVLSTLTFTGTATRIVAEAPAASARTPTS